MAFPHLNSPRQPARLLCSNVSTCDELTNSSLSAKQTNKQLKITTKKPQCLANHLLSHCNLQELQRIKTLTLNNNAFLVDVEMPTGHWHSRPCLTQVFDFTFSDRE